MKERSADARRIIAAEEAREALSRDEMEVIRCIARSLSNNGIAERLGISPKTVDSHRISMVRKLSVHSTATLLIRPISDGLIDV